MKEISRILLAACIFLAVISATSSNAEELTVAVAANFTGPMKKISKLFTEKTGIEILPSYGSTGKLYALIDNGAPFDVFLAADQKRPELLYQQHLVSKPVIYAKGQAVLWTSRLDTCKAHTWKKALRLPQFKRISIANPKLAPYGAAAMAAITPGIKAELTARLVYGENVSQSFQYAQKATDAGFTALSFALSSSGKQGCYWLITEAPLVKQSACIIQNTRHKKAARTFLSFLLSDQSKPVMKELGYK